MKIRKAIARGAEAAKQTFRPRKYQAAGKLIQMLPLRRDSFEIPRGMVFFADTRCSAHGADISNALEKNRVEIS